jgi:alpha-L-arabinofuranosidase
METTVHLADASFEGAAMAYQVTGKDPDSTNSFDRQEVGVSERSVQTGGHSFEHGIPACSITVLRVGVAG